MKIFAILTIAACVLSQTFGLRRLRPQLDGRIVGGQAANIWDYPYQLSYQYGGSHICGASILNANTALTAAHCTAAASTSISVRAGTSFVGSGGQVVNVGQIYQHPQYNSATTNNDVSVLSLRTSLSFGPNVAAIGLQPLGQEPGTGAAAIVSGWGALNEGGGSPSQLQQVAVHHVSRSACNSAYGGGITSQMICYGDQGKDSCQGDSGGPLVGNGRQVGIVSWGYGCARPQYPGVYTNVADSSIHNHITLYSK